MQSFGNLKPEDFNLERLFMMVRTGIYSTVAMEAAIEIYSLQPSCKKLLQFSLCQTTTTSQKGVRLLFKKDAVLVDAKIYFLATAENKST
jgi:hypothetical protein